MKHNNYLGYLLAATALSSLVACSDDVTPPGPDQPQEPEAQYVGQAVGNFKADEWYPGGKLGTTENVSSSCYEDNTPAVDQQGLADLFNPVLRAVRANIATPEAMHTGTVAATWSL